MEYKDDGEVAIRREVISARNSELINELKYERRARKAHSPYARCEKCGMTPAYTPPDYPCNHSN